MSCFFFVLRRAIEIGPNLPRKPLVGQGLPLPRRRAHSALQRGTWGALCALCQERLRLLPLLLFLQSKHLLLVAMIYCRLDRQDGVLIVAVPLHTMSVNVGGILNGNELPVRQLRNVLHHSGHGQVYYSGDGAVTGMTLMCAAILTVEQIGVDGDSSVTDVQKEKFIGQREKFLLVFL